MGTDEHYLGLDAGGTATRWAVVDARGDAVAEGSTVACSGLQLLDTAGTAALTATLVGIAAQTGAVHGIAAGFTGLGDAQMAPIQALLAHTFGVPPNRVQALSDIALLCRSSFARGAGLVVYAGTGAIAALIDGEGSLQRAGGRGHLIDDAGGGHWLAREALKHVWRAEDESPGAWQQSPLARALFARLGGADWAHTRAWVYGADRGELGTLALAVAEAAEHDTTARALLQAAGAELARLARALIHRHGPMPVALAGRVFELHPTIEQHLGEALPPGTPVQRLSTPAHLAAARLAAGITNPTRTTR